MNPHKLLPYFERLESLMGKLPAGLQKPILKELTPLKELFLKQRPARLLILGSKQLSIGDVAALFFNEAVSSFVSDEMPQGWMEFGDSRCGRLVLLDGRRAEDVVNHLTERAALELGPDLTLFIRSGRDIDGDISMDLAHASTFLDGLVKGRDFRPVLLGAQTAPAAEEARMELHAMLLAQPTLSRWLGGTVRLGISPQGRTFIRTLLAKLPAETHLEMARVSKDQESQKEIAQTLVRSNAAICAALGAQPIPLADLPILTALQSAMVAGIIHVSGRSAGLRTAGEFTGALGLNLGAGVVLREASRALLKLFPFWGNAISGLIAGAGTYALGRAAIGYFIEGVGLKQARSIFKREKDSIKLKQPELSEIEE